MSGHGLSIQTTLTSDEIASTCNLIVTATPYHDPLLRVEQIREGTHITAMGSDTREKNELEPEILGKADRRYPDHRRRSHRRCRPGHPDLEGGVRDPALIPSVRRQARRGPNSRRGVV